MIKVEIWKHIPGWEGLYQASNQGNIRSLDRTIRRRGGHMVPYKGKIISCPIAKVGYRVFSLWTGNRSTRYYVHKAVALAFLGPPPNKNSWINHKDGNKTNNKASNLEWGSPGHNMKHAYDTGLKKTIYNGRGKPKLNPNWIKRNK